jgi:hypothetical protein
METLGQKIRASKFSSNKRDGLNLLKFFSLRSMLACWPRGRVRDRGRTRVPWQPLRSSREKEGGGRGEEVAQVRTSKYMNGGMDVMSSSATDADSVPDHLVVMVHGILGR